MIIYESDGGDIEHTWRIRGDAILRVRTLRPPTLTQKSRGDSANQLARIKV